MSKVQVDTIVDKDDISAPSLTKGAIVTGVCTATSFDGAISEWVLGANGSSDYTFTGSGLTGAENDPTLYLKRGQKYRFKNSSGGHPFRIQSTANGSTGTAYNDGVTNNDAGNGTTLEWDVQFDAPDVLYYQCTSHGGMGGKIYIGNSGNSSTLVDLNVSGVTTTGIATVTTSVVVGSAVTANADGVITAGVGTFGSVVSSGAISGTTGTYTGDVTVVKSTGPLLELTTNTNAADATLRLSEGATGSTSNGGGMFYSGADNKLHITCGTDSTTKRITILRDTGLLGIGTESPESKVTVAGDSATSQLELKRTNTNTTGAVGAINWTAIDGHSVANMYALGDGDNEGAHLVFKTTTAAASNDPFDASTVERLRIGSQGELGIAGANYGTSGQVLTSGGSGSAISWATPSGGAWEVVSTQALSSSYTTGYVESTGWSNSYARYAMTFDGIANSANFKIWIQIYADNTSGNTGTLLTGNDYHRGSLASKIGSSNSGGSIAVHAYAAYQPQHILCDNSGKSEYTAGEFIFPMNNRTSGAPNAFKRWSGRHIAYDEEYLQDSCWMSESSYHTTGVRVSFYNTSNNAYVTPTDGRVTILRMKYS